MSDLRCLRKLGSARRVLGEATDVRKFRKSDTGPHRTLRTCFDPEIPVNIYELGLIYGVQVDSAGVVSIKMTLTSPHCPAAQSMPAEIEGKVKVVPGVTDVTIDLVWDPPWDWSKMSEAARLQLGMM